MNTVKFEIEIPIIPEDGGCSEGGCPLFQFSEYDGDCCSLDFAAEMKDRFDTLKPGPVCPGRRK